MIGLLLALAGAVPSDCPDALQGVWFGTEYACGVVRVTDPLKVSTHPPPRRTQEWAATYEIDGNDVWVVYDGRYRSYWDHEREALADKPWSHGEPSRKRMTIVDRCSARTDRWPPVVYREEEGCRVPYGAYNWIPGAPDHATMAPEVYVARQIGERGNFELMKDPHPGLHPAMVPVHLALPQHLAYSFRFIGTEQHGTVEGKRWIWPLQMINDDRTSMGGGSLDYARRSLDTADRYADEGDFHSAVAKYSETIWRSESCKPDEQKGGIEWRELADAARMEDEGMRGGPPGVKADRAGLRRISAAIHRMQELGGCHEQVRSPKADAGLEEEAKRIEEMVPTANGRAEAARLRAMIER